MKLRTYLIVGLVLSMTACTQEDQADPEFLAHMHRHAEYLDALNMALAEGDFDAAMTPAYWLSRHDEVDGLPTAWQPYLESVREAAHNVENSVDLESARAAAEPITLQCQGCHTAAGVDEE